MENTYQKFNNLAIGETKTLTFGTNEIYEFTKIHEFQFLVTHSFYVLKKWVNLTTTMTTMEASIIYENI